jgi:LysM repeat protein
VIEGKPMPTRRLLPLLILLLLVLPGCFRQAGEAYDPSNDTAGQTAPDAGATSQEVATLEPTTDNNNPPLTVISATVETPTATDEGASLQGSDDETPQETNNPLVIPTSEPEEETATPTEAPAFLTPNTFPITDTAPTLAPNVTPTSTPSGLITPTALGEGPTGDGCTYTVQPNNTLFSLANANNITLDQLRAANPEVVGDLLQIGQILNIPGCGGGLDDAGNPLLPPTSAPSVNSSGQTIHVVQSGETLVRIARQYGVTVQDIVNANNLANPNLLDVGQELIIPTATP